jgi:hypothetical protein
MKQQFKFGDKVRCTNDDNGFYTAIKKDIIYTFSHYSGDEYEYVHLVEKNPNSKYGGHFSDRFELVETSPEQKFKEGPFDINAPTENHRTKAGDKILWIEDTGLDINYPIAVIQEQDATSARLYTRQGRFTLIESSDFDLITLVPVKDVVTYLEIDEHGVVSTTARTFREAYEVFKSETSLAIIKHTMNQETFESTCEVVWLKGDKIVKFRSWE